MTDYYDFLETRDPDAREDALFLERPRHIEYAKRCVPEFARILAGVNPAVITRREALAQLPVTFKADLIARKFRIRNGDASITGGLPARCSPPDSARGVSCATALLITSCLKDP